MASTKVVGSDSSFPFPLPLPLSWKNKINKIVIFLKAHLTAIVWNKDSVSPRLPPSVRPPPSPTASALPIKSPQPHHRNHSLGSVNSHRVTRRKSMSSTSGANMAAVVQAAKEAAAEVPFSLPVPSAGVGLARSPGRSNGKVIAFGKTGTGSAVVGGSNGYPSPPSSLPTSGPFSSNGATAGIGGASQNLSFPRKTGSFGNGSGDSAIAEGYGPDVKSLGRRRASEGAHLILGGTPGVGEGAGSTPGRGSRARSGSELKCDKCGKGYKHSSCLTKHLFVLPLHIVLPGFRSNKNYFLLLLPHTSYWEPSRLPFVSMHRKFPFHCTL